MPPYTLLLVVPRGLESPSLSELITKTPIPIPLSNTSLHVEILHTYGLILLHNIPFPTQTDFIQFVKSCSKLMTLESIHLLLGNWIIPKLVLNNELIPKDERLKGFESVLLELNMGFNNGKTVDWENAWNVWEELVDYGDEKRGVVKSDSAVALDSNSNDKTTIPFRATLDKFDQKYPGIATQDLAGAIGSYVVNTFKSETYSPILTSRNAELKVNLRGYKLEVMCHFVSMPGSFGEAVSVVSNANNTAEPMMTTSSLPTITPSTHTRTLLSLTLPITLPTISLRHRLEFGRTSLRPTIATALLLYANPLPYETILDPCAGTGTIPIEASKLGIPLHILGADIDSSALTSFNKNTNYALNCPCHGSKTTSVMDILNWSGRNTLPLRSNSVNKVITDLPWGRRENSHTQNARLYPRLLKEIARVLKFNGSAYLLTGERGLMKRCLDGNERLRCEEVVDVVIGYRVGLYVLTKVK